MFHRSRRKWGGDLAKHKKKVFVIRSGVVVLSLLVLLISLSFLSKYSKLLISEINVSGNSVVSTDDILGVVERNLSGAHFWLFSKRNIFLYSKKKIESEIRTEFKKIKDIDISLMDFKNLSLEVTERKPNSMWCGVEFNLASTDCYFLDGDGFIYSNAPDFSGNVFFKVYGPLPSKNDPIGQNFLPVSKYQNQTFFNGVVLQGGLESVALLKLPDNDVEIYFEGGGKAIFNLNQNINKVSNDLISILNDDNFKNLFNDGERQLDYIDLRFDNRAYYKFK